MQSLCTQCVLNYSWIVLCSSWSKICVYLSESAQNRADSDHEETSGKKHLLGAMYILMYRKICCDIC